MNKIFDLPKDELGERLYQRIYLLIKKNQWGWATRGAACGLLGGMLSIILGALLWAIVPLLLQGSMRSFLNVLETVFFVLPLPLLALGAYCLDLLEKRTPIHSLPSQFRSARFESVRRLRLQSPRQN